MSKLAKDNVIIFLLLLCSGCLLSGYLGYEFKWDFTNYHYYNPWAFLTGRLDIDISPASVNTYFNPLIDLPFYFLIQNFNDYPRFVSAIQGSYFGILLFVFYKICTLFFSPHNWQGRIKIVLAMFVGATGFATFKQLGTTTNEIQISILVLWSFYLLLKEIFVSQSNRNKIFWWSGVILGVSLGLKPTCIIYCVSGGLTLIIFSNQYDKPLLKIFLFILGGLVGYLLVNGFWMLTLWGEFQNPFFPFLNKIFQSEYFDNLNFSDKRFLPKSIWQFLFYPFFWLSFDQGYVCEIMFWDIRFVLLEIIAFIWVIQVFRKKIFTSEINRFLYVLIFFSYILWLVVFSIMRYLIPVEMLTAIVLVQFFSSVPYRKGFIEILYSSFVIVLFYILITVPFQSHSFGNRLEDEKIIDVEPIEIKDGTLIILYNMPSAAIAAYWGQQTKNLRIIGTNQINTVKQEGSDFADRNKYKEMKEKLIKQTPPKKIMALVRLWCSYDCYQKLLDDERLNEMYCRKLKNNLDELLYICRYHKWPDMTSKGLKNCK